jgi:tRNA(Ile)-lysidine synthetase-like protein
MASSLKAPAKPAAARGAKKTDAAKAADAIRPEKIRAIAKAALASHLRRSDKKIVVALSGGLDSVCLLHILVTITTRASADLFSGGRVLAAAHINHNLSPLSAKWESFCRELCAGWNIPLECASLSPPPANEAQARRMRYRALAEVGADVVVCAHHHDDQVETALFRFLRGAGMRGLAAMAVCAPMPAAPRKTRLVRPLLGITKAGLREYARRENLDWMEDDDNRNLARRRNFLRRRLLPLAEESIPAARAGIIHCCKRAADAVQLLEQLADLDAENAAIAAEKKIANAEERIATVAAKKTAAENPAKGIVAENAAQRIAAENPAQKIAEIKKTPLTPAASSPDGYETHFFIPPPAAGDISYWRRVGEARTRNWLAVNLRRQNAPAAAARHIAEAARQICEARSGATLRFSFGDNIELRTRRGLIYWRRNNKTTPNPA